MRLRVLLIVLFVAAVADSNAFFSGVPDTIPVKGYRLIWRDEFDGNTLDRSKWMFRAPGKRGDAFNVPQAVELDGSGHLVINTFVRGDSVLSGMIATEGLFATKYGYFECRTSLTRVHGIWPAFWLQSTINSEHGTPAKNGAEIDVFEYFPHLRVDAVAHTLHYGGYGATHQVAGPVWGPLQSTGDGFHVFGLEWTPTQYTTYVDGVKTFTGSELISHQPEFLVLSVEANTLVGGKLSTAQLPDRFVVDYVRVYKKKPL